MRANCSACGIASSCGLRQKSRRPRPPSAALFRSKRQMCLWPSVPWLSRRGMLVWRPAASRGRWLQQSQGLCLMPYSLCGTPCTPCRRDLCPFVKETDDVLTSENLRITVYKMQFVAEEDMAEYAPHVIDEVGIKEIHTPTVACRRKTAEHQQPCVFRQKRP